ncbi:phosphoglycerate mutase family protein [Rubellimicrobium mesophilum DSM 19309]|uniref:Phosphoglycerate mutase family protein n=1 Tax=Rubellimicrobium mesophilum DSM 19309 TaxID=442562 RepID=A0A017HRL4_9RHOB|nr:histidine phosphatase family protein [Rubellimicrobium mesophilum]EYD76808.1 phosphoglycerate mutase family protein [Rubellimicrobium mesophilum DSM 19309]
MTLTLLIRHAKSEPGSPAQADHERPLAKRGRHDAPLIGRWIAGQGLVPGEVLCSDAVRTRETLDLMLPEWSEPPRLAYLAELYHATPETMLRALEQAEAERVALVGHNPGIAALAANLAREAPVHLRWADFPTCAVAALRFEADSWFAIGEGRGKVLAFATPADLG